MSEALIALTEEEQSKDEFFQRIAHIAQEMVAKHGKDFSAGALLLAARWIAEDRIAPAAPAPSTQGA